MGGPSIFPNGPALPQFSFKSFARGRAQAKFGVHGFRREVTLSDENRSPTIDYLRAFSILWVLTYHFVPLKIFSKGTDGVLLFFIISGYCIAVSSATSTSAWHFYAKRLGRLLPALVVCSFITTALKHMAPGLIEPNRLLSWWEMAYTWVALPTLNLLHIGYHWPDLAYWSLEIEFHFYALVFVVMLLGLRRHLLLAVCGYVFAKVCLLQGLQTNFDFYPFFIAGLSVASLNAGRSLPGWFGIGFAVLLDMYFLVRGFQDPSAPIEWSRSAVLWAGTAALIAAIKIQPPDPIRKILSPLAYVGLVSYPLYLIHQDVGNMLLRLIGIPYIDMPFPTTFRLLFVPLFFTAVAGLIHAFVERPLIAPLTGLLSGKRKPEAARIVTSAAGAEDRAQMNAGFTID